MREMHTALTFKFSREVYLLIRLGLQRHMNFQE